MGAQPGQRDDPCQVQQDVRLEYHHPSGENERSTEGYKPNIKCYHAPPPHPPSPPKIMQVLQLTILPRVLRRELCGHHVCDVFCNVVWRGSGVVWIFVVAIVPWFLRVRGMYVC